MRTRQSSLPTPASASDAGGVGLRGYQQRGGATHLGSEWPNQTDDFKRESLTGLNLRNDFASRQHGVRVKVFGTLG